MYSGSTVQAVGIVEQLACVGLVYDPVQRVGSRPVRLATNAPAAIVWFATKPRRPTMNVSIQFLAIYHRRDTYLHRVFTRLHRFGKALRASRLVFSGVRCQSPSFTSSRHVSFPLFSSRRAKKYDSHHSTCYDDHHRTIPPGTYHHAKPPTNNRHSLATVGSGGIRHRGCPVSTHRRTHSRDSRSN